MPVAIDAFKYILKLTLQCNSTCKRRAVMISLFMILFSFPSIILCNVIPSYGKLPLSPNAMGPEALAFNSKGGGPYTGMEDGRILQYLGPCVGFHDFAFTSPNRSKRVCDGNTNSSLGSVCGRTFGLGFYFRTGDLYIADIYLGLLVVGQNGRLATQLANSADGVPFRFTNALDVDQRTGIVYFTDSSSVYPRSAVEEAVARGDATGRLLKFDTRTGQVTVLLGGLKSSGGAAVNKDGSFVLVTEYGANRVQKYWLKGPKANTSEILVSLPGRPGNIKRTPLGDFWVAVNVNTTTIRPTGMKINGLGQILQTVALDALYNNKSVSEIQEFRGKLYIGSNVASFVGVVKI
ncbi:protein STRICTOSIDINE SYNTHASE-LIKE 11-like [Tripterygium wilfordii]|uniref:protein STRICTOSIDINE SYNTHASE-LIKE 11-like n=1 Tax=Tripterygium wilfordii TaxID=458696 RepID=UPI0018F86155|nr:protein STRICTOSIDINE SYNTHASE-LIKE 11-like [Tripterygium wilfordii]XP_038688093.1 protein STRICTOSIDINE SYNTHASE-LIKE 11-like [Tripterygium wilfordii]